MARRRRDQNLHLTRTDFTASLHIRLIVVDAATGSLAIRLHGREPQRERELVLLELGVHAGCRGYLLYYQVDDSPGSDGEGALLENPLALQKVFERVAERVSSLSKLKSVLVTDSHAQLLTETLLPASKKYYPCAPMFPRA